MDSLILESFGIKVHKHYIKVEAYYLIPTFIPFSSSTRIVGIEASIWSNVFE